MTVTLTWSEVVQAGIVGVMRMTTNLRDKRRAAHGLGDGEPWGIHIEGCCGEMAASKALGVFWSGSHGIIRAPDIGGALQVRTALKSTHSLILHREDPDDAVFVLVVGTAPTFEVVGWLEGRYGKQPAYWRDPGTGRPAYFVPQHVLNPLDTLTV